MLPNNNSHLGIIADIIQKNDKRVVDTKNVVVTTRTNLRYVKTLHWLKDIQGACLNIAEGGYLKDMISEKFSVEIPETNIDLDYLTNGELGANKYNHIFCFEVVEHIVNVGNFMLSMAHAMKNDGYLYISTPIRPGFLRNKKTHFHEFKMNELQYLIDFAKLRIVEAKLINPFSIKWVIKNAWKIKPVLLWLFSRTILLKLGKL